MRRWVDSSEYDIGSKLIIRLQRSYTQNLQIKSVDHLYIPKDANDQVRYCVKFKPKTGQLVLRLTDDTTVSNSNT
jgi:hypothetical protein